MMRCSECNRHVQPVVGIDIDGTIADYHGHFLAFARGWLPPEHVWPEEQYDGQLSLSAHLRISRTTYREIKLAYRQGGMKRTMPVHSLAKQLVDTLRDEGAEVWITTTRPYMRLDNVDPDTREWLRRHRLEYDGLIYDDDKYGRLLSLVGPDRIVGVLEDLPDKFDRAADLGIRPILKRNDYNGAHHRDPSVATLAQAQQQLQQRVREWKEQHGSQR